MNRRLERESETFAWTKTADLALAFRQGNPRVRLEACRASSGATCLLRRVGR